MKKKNYSLTLDEEKINLLKQKNINISKFVNNLLNNYDIENEKFIENINKIQVIEREEQMNKRQLVFLEDIKKLIVRNIIFSSFKDNSAVFKNKLNSSIELCKHQKEKADLLMMGNDVKKEIDNWIELLSSGKFDDLYIELYPEKNWKQKLYHIGKVLRLNDTQIQNILDYIEKSKKLPKLKIKTEISEE